VDRIPSALFRVFFHDDSGTWLRWHTDRLWALPTPVTLRNAEDLWWHLELPVWRSTPEARFDLSPKEVLAAPERYAAEWQQVLNTDLSYPLELFDSFGRWVIMDGYHRLARHFLDGSSVIPVRYHDPSLLPTILRPRYG
jgi:hypothetical protein